MTTSTGSTYSTYQADTYLWQGEEEFRCGWNFSGTFNDECAITHLTETLEANDAGEEVFEDDNGEEFQLNGMTPKEFATFIVQDEEAAKEMYGTTWEINTGKEVE